MIFIHGDLPLLVPEEIDALIQAAGGGCALAPDRHGSGTNAIALMAAAPFEFAFGENSLALHRTTSGRRAAIVRRLGLSLDVDTPDDLDAAIAAGFSMPNCSAQRRDNDAVSAVHPFRAKSLIRGHKLRRKNGGSGRE